MKHLPEQGLMAHAEDEGIT